MNFWFAVWLFLVAVLIFLFLFSLVRILRAHERAFVGLHVKSSSCIV